MRQSPSLQNFLTRAKFEHIDETPAVRKCQKQDVQHVFTYRKANSSNKKNGRHFSILSSITCESSNLIYDIKCSLFGEHCIGQTGDKPRYQMTVHRQKNRKNTSARL